MSFGSIMKKIGGGVVKAVTFGTVGVGIAQTVSGMARLGGQNKLASGIDRGLGVFEQVSTVVALVENFFTSAFPGQKVSTEKLQAALPQVKDIILSSELLVGRKVVDETRFTQGLEKLVAAGVDIFHAIDDKTEDEHIAEIRAQEREQERINAKMYNNPTGQERLKY